MRYHPTAMHHVRKFLVARGVHRRSLYPTAKLRPRGRSRTRWGSRSHADVGGATAARVRACRSPAVGLADGCVRHNDSHLRKTPDAARSSLCDGFGRDSASSCRPSGHRARFRGLLFLSGGAAAVHGLRVLHRVPRPPPTPFCATELSPPLTLLFSGRSAVSRPLPYDISSSSRSLSSRAASRALASSRLTSVLNRLPSSRLQRCSLASRRRGLPRGN